jgi:hypothetical protein
MKYLVIREASQAKPATHWYYADDAAAAVRRCAREHGYAGQLLVVRSDCVQHFGLRPEWVETTDAAG